MRVKLLQDIMENGGVKISQRRNKLWHPPVKTEDGEYLECEESQFRIVAYTKGAVVEVSDSTGLKWISRKWAEEVKAEVAE